MTKDKKLRILIAEDDFLVAEMIKGQLEQLGHEVLDIATNGHYAAEKVRDLKPDLVMMDINMPDMDGIDGMRLIRKHFPTPVVVLTAYESPDLFKRATKAGAGAYLIKPSNLQEIERAIEISVARFDDLMELQKLNTELNTALDNIKTLEALIPICVNCKKVRDDEGYWTEVENYLLKHSGVSIEKNLCPKCMKEIYPEFDTDK